MILYETAKRLERRSRLQSRIGETVGDTRELVLEKERVEVELQQQADEWKVNYPGALGKVSNGKE